MNKLRRLYIAFKILWSQGDIILRPITWNTHDRAQWGFFLAGQTGQKLFDIVDNEIIAMALTGDPAFKGYQKAKAMLMFLKISAAVPTDSNSREVDAPSTTESEDGETSILERYSP